MSNFGWSKGFERLRWMALDGAWTESKKRERLARWIEERFLDCASRQLHGMKLKKKRRDAPVGMTVFEWMVGVGDKIRWESPHSKNEEDATRRRNSRFLTRLEKAAGSE